MKIKFAFSRITRKRQDENVFLGAPFGAVIEFENGYYWEIPANHHDAVKVAELAEDVAGENLSSILFLGGTEIAFRCRRRSQGFGLSRRAALRSGGWSR